MFYLHMYKGYIHKVNISLTQITMIVQLLAGIYHRNHAVLANTG